MARLPFCRYRPAPGALRGPPDCLAGRGAPFRRAGISSARGPVFSRAIAEGVTCGAMRSPLLRAAACVG